MYNETIQNLQARISKAGGQKAIPLTGSLARVSNLKIFAEKNIGEQIKERNRIANKIHEWKNLPLLDEEIAQARLQPLR